MRALPYVVLGAVVLIAMAIYLAVAVARGKYDDAEQYAHRAARR